LNKVQLLENKVADLEEMIIDKANDTKQAQNLLEKTIVTPSLGFKCEMCDLVAESSSGLDTHMKKNHEEPESESKQIIENLNKHKEIEKVLSVIVDSRCRKFYDSCQLRETMPFQNGRINRAEYLRYRNETGWR
jgi:hypothetical protein